MTLSGKHIAALVSSFLALVISFSIVNLVPGLSRTVYAANVVVWVFALLTFVITLLNLKESDTVQESDYNQIYTLTR